MGIICACLPTLRPLFSHLREMSKYGSSNRASSLEKDALGINKKSIALRKVRSSRPALDKSNVGESGTGFAKLPGDIESKIDGLGLGMAGSGEATVTTRVGTSPSGFEERPAAVPEKILRQQTVEQHHHHRRISEF